MKIRTFLILLFVFFGFALWTSRVTLGSNWPERSGFSFAVSMTVLAAGGFIAVVSLFVLLQRGLSGQSLEHSLPLVIALLGGLLLYQVNWGAALALGLIGAAAIVTQALGGPKSPPKS
jgi:hypothetical protein